MRMIRTAAALLAFFITAHAAVAQSSAIVVKAGTVSGKFEAPFGNRLMDERESVRKPVYGLELILKASSRVSVGIEGIFKTQFQDTSDSLISAKDSFTYIDNGSLLTYSDPGKVFASYTLRTEAKIKSTILGSLYFNLASARSHVRPFFGGGFGVAFAEKTYLTDTYVDPIYFEKAGFAYQIDPRYTVAEKIPVWKGEGGLVVRAGRRLWIRGSVRVMNRLVMPTLGLQMQ